MYYMRRAHIFSRSLRKILRAQEHAAAKRDEEMRAFRQGKTYEACNERNLAKQASCAIHAARSVLGALTAEKEVVACIVDEARANLQSMNRIASDLDGRLFLAEDQLGTLMEAVHRQGLSLSSHSDDDIQIPSRPRRGSSSSLSSRRRVSENETDRDHRMRDLSDNESVNRGRSHSRTTKSLVASVHAEGG